MHLSYGCRSTHYRHSPRKQAAVSMIDTVYVRLVSRNAVPHTRHALGVKAAGIGTETRR